MVMCDLDHFKPVNDILDTWRETLY